MTSHPAPSVRSGRIVTALAWRALADARVRTIAFAYVFGIYAWLEAAGYRGAYPTPADRVSFAHAFAGNDAIRLFYGYPYDVSTVGGYSAWRVGGTLALAAAAFGMLAGVRALRGEEAAGRADVVLSGAVSRRGYVGSAMAACAAQLAAIWSAEFVGFVIGHLPVAGSAFLALATVSVGAVFVGVGSLASQMASTPSGALGLAAGVGVVAWLARVVADTIPGASWLRWSMPLGWAEASRPFNGNRLGVLGLPLVVTGGLVVTSVVIATRRDVGTGLFPGRSDASPRLGLLRTCTAQAVRAQRGVLAAWAVGICGAAAVLGMISTSISGAGLSKRLRDELARFGAGSFTTPAGYLSLIFMVFVVAVALFGCAQVSAAGRQETGGQLETLLAQPVGRTRWLAGRLAVGLLAMVVLGELAGLLAWVGSASQGVHSGLWTLLEAGSNCVFVGCLFLGLSALLYAVAPGAGAPASYLLVSVSFLWYVVGSLFRFPRWLQDATPFAHVGLVPAQAFQPVGAAACTGIGLVGGAAAVVFFGRRDIRSAGSS